MFDHVGIRAADRDASVRFYATVLATLGIEQTHDEDWLAEWDDFALSPADDEHPPARNLHIAFVAPTREHADAFWQAGIDAGHRDAGAPGPRPQYSDDYYGAFLLDPDGNSVEAVHGRHTRSPGVIDHLWLRTRDLGAIRRFYATIAPHAGLSAGADTPERVQFRTPSASFSFVPGDKPTEHVHIAFPASDDATVDAFHATTTAAGYEDHGAPGERPEYHPGYYGAFVLDPDGHNIEVVHHTR